MFFFLFSSQTIFHHFSALSSPQVSNPSKTPKSHPFPSVFLKITKPSNLQTLNHFFSSSYQIWLIVASKIGSKCKGKEPLHEESPPHYDHSIYLLQEAFNRYSTRTITVGRIINFAHLDFIGFNQLMRRLRWFTFARMSNPSYPSLLDDFMPIYLDPVSKGCI